MSRNAPQPTLRLCRSGELPPQQKTWTACTLWEGLFRKPPLPRLKSYDCSMKSAHRPQSPQLAAAISDLLPVAYCLRCWRLTGLLAPGIKMRSLRSCRPSPQHWRKLFWGGCVKSLLCLPPAVQDLLRAPRWLTSAAWRPRAVPSSDVQDGTWKSRDSSARLSSRSWSARKYMSPRLRRSPCSVWVGRVSRWFLRTTKVGCAPIHSLNLMVAGRTPDLGDEVTRPIVSALSGVPRNPPSVR